MSSFATFSSFGRCSFHQAALTEGTSTCTDCRDLPGARSGRGLGLRILPTEGIPVFFSIGRVVRVVSLLLFRTSV